MNIILLAPEDWLDESTVCLDDRRHEHIRGVLKAEIDDALRVGLLGGLRGSGTVIKLSDERTHLQVDLVDPPLPRHPCDLILALPRFLNPLMVGILKNLEANLRLKLF